jgi:outer membrane protein assembly factor BamC
MKCFYPWPCLPFRLILTVAMALLLASCSGVLPESKKIDYKSASRRASPLEIPPDLTQVSRDDRFAVPDFSGKGSATYSEYSAEREPAREAENSNVLPEIAKLKIARAGNQRWLVAQMPTDRLWDSVRDFWQEMGFIITTDAPEAGVMETDWAENRANIPSDFIRNTLGKLLDTLYSTGERDRFRTRFEPGEAAGATDIFISHRRMEEVYSSENKSETRWQPAAADPHLEAEMLRRLMIRLGSDERRAEVALAAVKSEDRARLARSDDGVETLEIQERFDRAWRRVGLALDRVGFTVEDRDRSRGLYFVRYVDPEADSKKKEEGWFSRVFSWGSKEPVRQTQYRIHLAEAGDVTRVQAFSDEARDDSLENTKKILALLWEQLR